MTKMRRRVFAAGSAAFAFFPYIVRAQKKYDTGVTDKEIKLGHTNPYSGPLSAYGTIGKAIEAYWKMAKTLSSSTSLRTISTVLGGE